MADPTKLADVCDKEDELSELDLAQKDRLHYLMSKLKPEDLQSSGDEADEDKSVSTKKKKKSKRPKSKRGNVCDEMTLLAILHIP
jgi:hypothetical protein